MKPLAIHPERTTEPAERLLIDVRTVADLLTVSVRTIERMVKNREFVQPIRLNARTVRWSRAAVEAWIAERSAAAVDVGPSRTLSLLPISEG